MEGTDPRVDPIDHERNLQDLENLLRAAYQDCAVEKETSHQEVSFTFRVRRGDTPEGRELYALALASES